VLSNVVPEQAEARLRNFASHGFDFPLVTNSGSKGAAVRALAVRAGEPAFFVDDIPQHLASAAKLAPEVFRIHMIGDERLKPLLPPAEDAHLRAQTWADVEAFIRSKL
jgi:ribonucleotide monophosphatase NagD (HAD superfamily)